MFFILTDISHTVKLLGNNSPGVQPHNQHHEPSNRSVVHLMHASFFYAGGPLMQEVWVA